MGWTTSSATYATPPPASAAVTVFPVLPDPPRGSPGHQCGSAGRPQPCTFRTRRRRPGCFVSWSGKRSACSEGLRGSDCASDQSETDIAGKLECLSRQLELADDSVEERLGGGAVELDVMRRPPGCGTRCCGWPTPHKVGQGAVVGPAAGLAAQGGCGVSGGGLPGALIASRSRRTPGRTPRGALVRRGCAPDRGRWWPAHRLSSPISL
jgi:hypothetical protein